MRVLLQNLWCQLFHQIWWIKGVDYFWEERNGRRWVGNYYCKKCDRKWKVVY